MSKTDATFRLKDSFVDKYKDRKPPFGFNGLGELVYLRTYSRLKEDGKNEQWFETVRRVVEGTYRMQERHIKAQDLGWNEARAQKSAQEMYDRIYNMKFLPPGRGLWAMGSEITEERGLYAALNNCGYAATDTIDKDGAEPFAFLMDASMLGVGVGFGVDGAGKVKVVDPQFSTETYVIADSREGWVDSTAIVINAYFGIGSIPNFDYSGIRGPGLPIKGFGGVSSGPEPLIKLHKRLRDVLDKNIGREISITTIADCMNLEGVCVVAGNVRRTAEIMLGPADDEEYRNLKNYHWDAEKGKYVGPMAHRAEWGWTSNNSVVVRIGQDYSDLATSTARNGEPGYFWLDSARAYGRMCEPPNWKDRKVKGTNPCVTGETEILTDNGYVPIEVLDGETVKVWNGFEWSEVTPRVTGYDQPIVRVHLSSGQYLDCTPYHEFYVYDNGMPPYKGGKPTKVQAKSLAPGTALVKTDLPVVYSGEDVEWAYTQGFISAEGMDGYNHFTLYEPKYICKSRLHLRHCSREYSDEYHNATRQVAFPSFRALPKSFIPFGWSVQSRLDWLAGLLDGDGTVLNEGGIQVTSVDRVFLKNVQKLLTTLGVASKINHANKAGSRPMPDGHGGSKEYYCQDSYRVCISSQDVQKLISLGLKFERLDAETFRPNRNASRFVTVTEVEDLEYVADKVYCFTEPIRGLGCFEGIVTGQCSEQSLEDRELCCLVETFPDNHENFEDYKRTLKFAYLYAKTVTLGKTHWPKTNRVLLRNRRIGTSMSGIAQFIAHRGLDELKKWCEEGYKAIQEYDKSYSDWLAVPLSIKTTSIKPSGSVSLLAGATPGCHDPEDHYYIRRVRIGIHSGMLQPIIDAGYHVEPAVDDPSNTAVVEVPCSVDESIPTVKDTTIWEKTARAAFLQKYWADNQVSCTVSFSPEEAEQIKSVLDYFQYDLKGISFLPRVEAGAYAQMPYEAISKHEYLNRVSQLKPLNITDAAEEAEQERGCDGASCAI